jgi:hypothetical protein
MTDIHENIATLTGSLKFLIDIAGLRKFSAMLASADKQMQQFSKQAEALQKKLNMKFGVTGNAAQAKIDGAIQKSLDKQIATKQKLSRLQHAQNTAAISQRKLVATGQREEAFLQSASLKQQVASAILAAKQQKVQQELLKTKLGEARVQATSEQSKIREARYADILLKRQAATVKLQQQAALHQTKFQRAEAALSSARASGIRQAERYTASKAAAAAREARAQVRQEQQAKRFDFSAERHEAWKAKQAEPQGAGFGGLTVGLGAAGAAVYALAEGIGYLNERINKRTEAASDNQQFDFTLMAAGKNDKERARVKEAYIANSQEFGLKISRETAVAYSNQVQGFMAQGKSLEQAIQLQKDQAAVFRIGNLNKDQQYSAALQLNQGYGKDRFLGSDLRPLTDALGTRLTTILYQAIGKALGYKGDQSKLAGFVLEAQHDGKVNGAMVQQGMRDIVAQSPELLERHKHSLEAQAMRVENDQYLQGENINKDPELIAVLGERLTAEREVVEALKPLKDSLMEFDKGLTKFNTSVMRWMIGRNADGTESPNALHKDPNPHPGSVGAALGPRLKPAPLNEQGSLDERAQPGMWNSLRRFITGSTIEDDQTAADGNRERWGGGKFRINPIEAANFDVFRLGSSDLRADPENQADGNYRQFRQYTYQPLTSADIMRAADARVRQGQVLQPAYVGPGSEGSNGTSGSGNVDQSMHTDIKVDVVVNAREPDPDGKAIGEEVGKQVDLKVRQLLEQTRSAQKEIE